MYNLKVRVLIGVSNLIFGVVSSFVALSTLLFTLPKLNRMYAAMNVELSGSQTLNFLWPLLLLIVGIIQIVTALGIFQVIFKDKTDKFFRFGIILLVVFFIIGGLFYTFTFYSMLSPLYQLTAE